MRVCLRFFFFIFNFLLLGVGVAMVVGAGILLGRHREYGALLGQGIFILPLGLLLAGVVIFLISLLAIAGVLTDHACLLYTYSGLVLVVVVAEVVLLALLLVYKEEVEFAIQKAMLKVFARYGTKDPALTASLDYTHKQLKCCGVLTYSEWEDTEFGNSTAGVPDSCCRDYREGCGEGLLLANVTSLLHELHTAGCYTAVREKVGIGGVLFIAGVVILALLQLVCVSIACIMANNAGRRVEPLVGMWREKTGW